MVVSLPSNGNYQIRKSIRSLHALAFPGLRLRTSLLRSLSMLSMSDQSTLACSHREQIQASTTTAWSYSMARDVKIMGHIISNIWGSDWIWNSHTLNQNSIHYITYSHIEGTWNQCFHDLVQMHLVRQSRLKALLGSLVVVRWWVRFHDRPWGPSLYMWENRLELRTVDLINLWHRFICNSFFLTNDCVKLIG